MPNYYSPPKAIDPRKWGVSKFTLTVWELHRRGATVPEIVQALGADRRSVVRAITDVWEMDNPKATVCEHEVTIGQVLRDEFRDAP